MKTSLFVRAGVASLFVGLLHGPAWTGEAKMLKIVAFGDSTTAPRGALVVYSDLLRKELPSRGVGATVVNAGVGGNTTQMARARFRKDVLARKPDLVIIQFGINDSATDVWRNVTKPRVPKGRYEANLRYFVRTLKAKGARVILMTPNPLRWTPPLKKLYGKPPYDPNDIDGFNVLLKEYAAVVRCLAKELNVPLIDVYAAFEAYGKTAGRSVGDLLLDGMHPNAKGHRIIADMLIAEPDALWTRRSFFRRRP